MITWIAMKLGMSLLTTKLVLSGAVLMAILFAGWWYGHSQKEKGRKEGEKNILQTFEKDLKAKVAIEVKKLEADKQKNLEDAAVNRKEKEEIEKSRKLLEAEPARRIQELQKTLEKNRAVVINIPADKLDDALRALSTELAASSTATATK